MQNFEKISYVQCWQVIISFNYEETLKTFAETNFILAFPFGGHVGGHFLSNFPTNMAAKKEKLE